MCQRMSTVIEGITQDIKNNRNTIIYIMVFYIKLNIQSLVFLPFHRCTVDKRYFSEVAEGIFQKAKKNSSGSAEGTFLEDHFRKTGSGPLPRWAEIGPLRLPDGLRFGPVRSAPLRSGLPPVLRRSSAGPGGAASGPKYCDSRPILGVKRELYQRK